ncbi:hypothetical protein GQR58_008842 [Nymphon striatum]|nr:hypothetical protein GQR58_008842 [Nymphon striatum]
MSLLFRTRAISSKLKRFRNNSFQYEISQGKGFTSSSTVSAAQSSPTASSPVPQYSDSAQQSNLSDKREPFVKNLFKGIFDDSVLTFPEVLDRERLATLEEMVKPIQRYFEEKVLSAFCSIIEGTRALNCPDFHRTIPDFAPGSKIL